MGDYDYDKRHDDWKTGGYGQDQWDEEENEDDETSTYWDDEISEEGLDNVEVISLNELITEREE